MCRTYGWTPEQYRNTSISDIEIFKAINSGRRERKKINKNGK